MTYNPEAIRNTYDEIAEREGRFEKCDGVVTTRWSRLVQGGAPPHAATSVL